MSEIHAHAWVWAVVPPDCGPVSVAGDPQLAHVLARSGLDVILADDERPCDVVLAAGSLAPACTEDGRLLRPEARIVAVDLRPHVRWARRGRLGRGLQLLLAPLLERRGRAAVAAVGDALTVLGYAARPLPTGNRIAPWGLGEHATASAPPTDRPTGAIVVGRRADPAHARAEARPAARPGGRRPPKKPERIDPEWAEAGTAGADRPDESTLTVVSAAVEEAGLAIGRPLRSRGMVTLESGKILHDIVADDERYVLRTGAGPSGELIDASVLLLEHLATASPPAEVRSVVIWPIAHGTVGPARYVLERRAPGHHPRRVTNALWGECSGFLAALHLTGQDGRTASDQRFVDRVDAWCRRMSSHLPPAEVSLLSALGDRVLDAVRDVRLGFGHGDMWPANLLVEDGRLRAVLDWDWGSRDSLPMLDALELWAMTAASKAAAEPGPRAVDLLVPSARVGFDERLRSHARAIDLELDARTALALTAAYWLERSFRDLRPFSARPKDRRWFSANVIRPLRFLAREVPSR